MVVRSFLSHLPDGGRIINELHEAVAETAEELVVVVAGSEHQRALLDELVQRVDDAHHVGDGERWARQLVQYHAVHALVQALQ